MLSRLRNHAQASLLLAVGLTLVANVLLPLQDAMTKQAIAEVAVWEVLLVRSATVFVATLAIGRLPLVTRMVRTPLKGFMAARAAIMLAGWVTFYLALRHLPLAQTITLYFVSPIIVAIAAKPLLGEPSSFRQWIAILIGFAGVALAGGLTGFVISSGVGLALLSACFWAASLLMLRRSKEEATLVQVAFANGFFVVATAVPLVLYGFSGSAATVAWMVAIGVVGGTGQFALYEAARHVPAPVLSTLEYTCIVSGFVLGYLMFGEVPTLQIGIGAILILISGVLVVTVEQNRLQTAAPLARDLPLPIDPNLKPFLEHDMADKTHDLVVNYIAKTRFPFPKQTTWAADYQTLTNVPERKKAIATPSGEHYPDIVILDGTGRVREIGEIEMSVDETAIPYLKAGSETADSDTPTGVRHFFLYVPAGQEGAAQALLEANGISYAGVRGFDVKADGTVRIVPFVTRGDPYDHQITDTAAA